MKFLLVTSRGYQVGRKVAHVLESLGRSAESIQEAEVGIIMALNAL